MQEVKLCTFEAEGKVRVGAVVEEGVYDANLAVAAHQAETQAAGQAYRTANRLAPPRMVAFIRGGERSLNTLREAVAHVRSTRRNRGPEGEQLLWPLSRVRLRTPVPRPEKIICMGLTYMSHIQAVGAEVTTEPQFFIKPTMCLLDPEGCAILPRFWPDRVTFGTELTLVIGRRGFHIPREQVWEHIYGYTILNDLTLRGKPGISRKTFMTSAPVGPWIIPRDQVADPQKLRLLFHVNGRVVQDGNTSEARFDMPTIVSTVSDYLELHPGDLIATGDLGTQEVLQSGDVMECEVEGVGVLRNPVRAEE